MLHNDTCLYYIVSCALITYSTFFSSHLYIYYVFGEVATDVLREYLDSQIHCFDNAQERIPVGESKAKEMQAVEDRTDLATWQEGMLGHLRDDHCDDTKFANMTSTQIKDAYTENMSTPHICETKHYDLGLPN